MNNNKKILAPLLIAITILPLSACSNNDSGLPLLGRTDIEGHTVWVQKADGSIQCAPPIDQKASLITQRSTLISAGIDVLASDCGSEPADLACGLPTGGLNYFRIDSANEPVAVDLGFTPVLFDNDTPLAPPILPYEEALRLTSNAHCVPE